MIIQHTITKEKFFSIIVLLFCGIIIFITESSKLQVSVFIIQFLLTALLCKVKFDNPLFWYLGAFTIYSTGYPLLYVYEINISQGFSPDPLRWSWIAYFTFVIFFCYPKRTAYNNHIYVWFNKNAYTLFIHIAAVLILLSIFLILINGYTNKTSIYAGGNPLITLSFSLIYIVHTLYICVMQINYKINNRIDNRYLIVFIGIVSLLLTMFSGERDILFRFLIITSFSLYLNNEVKTRGITMIGVLLIILIPISRILKYYFLSLKSSSIDFDFSIHSFLNSLITGEFESASKNLQILANDSQNAMGALGGLSYISDITRILGFSPYSSLQWFNTNYYPGSIVGHGFSIVGEGYVNFGLAGVILNFIVIALLLGYVYKNRFKNEFYTTVFISIMPIMIYSIRADFANIFSPLCRQVILPLLLFNIIVKKKRITKK